MPVEHIGIFYNGIRGTTQPCDMIIGPCACGTVHDIEDWFKQLIVANHDLAIIHEHCNLADENEKSCFFDAVKMIRKRSAKYENLKLTAGPLYEEGIE